MRLPRTGSDATAGGAATGDRPDLLALLPDITRAVTGLRSDREIFEATMKIVGGSRAHGMVLVRPDDAAHMEASSMSMGGILMQGIRAVLHNPADLIRFGLSGAPTLRRALGGLAAQELTTLELSRELFQPEFADHVADLLGGPEGHAAVTPIRCGHAVIGTLVLIGGTDDQHTADACAAIAGNLSAALTFARVLRRVDRAREGLPPTETTRHALRSATETENVRLEGKRFFVPRAGANPSLVPYRLARTTAPPPPGTPTSGRARSGTHRGSEAPQPDGQWRAAVLIVEDERRLRESTAALLSGLGYRVESAASGEEAVAVYSRARDRGEGFDVVLLDQTLSGAMGGTETLRMLRSIEGSARAILLSGLADRASDEDLRRQGFFDRLAKPVALEQLNAAIERALDAQAPDGPR